MIKFLCLFYCHKSIAKLLKQGLALLEINCTKTKKVGKSKIYEQLLSYNNSSLIIIFDIPSYFVSSTVE